MITLEQLAGIIENGLNAQLNNPEIQFSIWASAGEEKDAIRTGNTITEYILGNLSSVSATNEGNILTMGMNSLLLELGVPIRRFKTDSAQTEEQLARIRNSQYPFISLISAAVDNYFQASQSFEHVEGEISYTVSMIAGRCITGDVDLAAQLGNYIKLSVYIDCYYLQGGVNSRNVILNLDNECVPLLSVSIGRMNRLNNDVYEGDHVVKNVSTATAVSIDFSAPSTSGMVTKKALQYLLQGKPNVAHFVELKYDNLESEMYLMMFDNLTSNAEGVSFAGIKGSLIEIADNSEMISVPDAFQITKFVFDNSQADSLTFTVTECLGYIAGVAQQMSGAQNITLSAADFAYDQTEDKYYVCLITDRAVTITDSSVSFEIVGG